MSQSPKSIALDQKIARMYVERQMSLEGIADALGITPQRVHQRLVRTGTPRRPAHKVRDPQAVKIVDDMLKARASLDACGVVLRKRFGLSIHTARKYSRERREQLREKKIQRAIHLYEIHRSTYTVGELVGVSDMTVLNWLRARGVDTTDARAYDDKTRKKALRLLERPGATHTSVAEQIGCSEKTVLNWARAAQGIPRERTRSPKETEWQLARRRRAAAKFRKEAKQRDRAVIASVNTERCER